LEKGCFSLDILIIETTAKLPEHRHCFG